jgi:glycosyltransferase involved in cell wall biosynthesis
VKVVIWHGYLLGGTGSNVYTRALARTWSRLGHEVVVLCQEPHPERFDLGGARVVRPALPGRLPVFVLDRYEDAEPVLLTEMPEAERDAFVEANAAAVRAELPADLVLTNHVLLGAPVGDAAGVRYVVKAHGSELEFAMRGDPALCDWARRTLRTARAVVAGSDHVAQVLDDLVQPPVPVEVVPPGVDVDDLVPQDRAHALAALIAECGHDVAGRGERHPDEGNGPRFAEFLAGDEPTLLYVGKLSQEKGVHLLVQAALRLGVRAVVVGFGPERAALEEQARGARVLFPGPLEHRHLRHLWALATASVTPSVFPEAFGMVAAEAAACGSPPVVARHSGLAEIAAAVEEEYPADLRGLASFERGDVDDLTETLRRLLALPPDRWAEVSQAARRAVERRWSWESVARRLEALA